MEWRDEGLVLGARRHGETAVILEAFTAAHGRHSGVVHGGQSKRLAALMQPGASLALAWSARLSDHLGTFRAELNYARAGLLSDPLALASLSSACALLHLALPEREPHPSLYFHTRSLFDALESAAPDGPLRYLRFELTLLEELGFGLDLSACAVTGVTQGLTWVSPKTGRAVSREAGADWADKLLPLPDCLRHLGPAPLDEVRSGLALTGWFLENRLLPALGHASLPESRARLLARLARA